MVGGRACDPILAHLSSPGAEIRLAPRRLLEASAVPEVVRNENLARTEAGVTPVGLVEAEWALAQGRHRAVQG